MVDEVSAASPVPDELLTVAERSDYRATARHAEVVALLDALAASSPLVRRGSLGDTGEGREIPWVSVADPPVEDADAARASGKLVVFAFGNIHAGEVCGKEALPRLVREIILSPATPEHARLLRELVLVIAPIYNGDGNERFSTTSRPGQLGPELGQGQRRNAAGLDLNRDAMKLESPEAQALTAFLTDWQPHLILDTHTTNGSLHRYTLTYAPPLNPSGHPGPLGFVRDTMLPAVSARLRERTGYDSFLYGNFQDQDGDEHGAWATYSSLPRFGAQNHGLRGHMSILTEAYSHAPYRDRVLVTLEFVRECLSYASEHGEQMRQTVEAAWEETAAGLGVAAGPVGIRHALAAAPEPAVIKGWVETRNEAGESERTSTPKDYTVTHYDRFEPTLEVSRPRGYLIPPDWPAVVAALRAHGLELTPWAGGPEVEVEIYRIDSLQHAAEPFEGHELLDLEVTSRREHRRVPGDAGWTHVPVAQRLGTLAIYLLEPAADDGLARWNFFDQGLAAGGDFPVLRLPSGG